MHFNIATFNIRGLNDQQKQNDLSQDVDKFEIDVVALQETKMKEGCDRNLGQHRLILHSTENPNYGTGFMISPKWAKSVYKSWNISDRLSVLQLDLEAKPNRIQKYTYKVRQVKRRTGINITIDRTKAQRRELITIINVYAPTSDLVNEDDSEICGIYSKISELIKEFKQNYVFIAGDFNARIGKRKRDETCLGRFSRGQRNAAGQRLIDFCNLNDLFIANSAFQHPARHITTWENNRITHFNANKDNAYTKMVTLRSQIDFVLVPNDYKRILTNARSHNGTLTFTDHRLVKCTTNIAPYKRYKRNNNSDKHKLFDCTKLTRDTNVRTQYQHEIQRHLSEPIPAESATQPTSNENESEWNQLKDFILQSAEKTVGFKEDRVRGRIFSPEVHKLSVQQKETKLQISNCDDVDKVTALRKQRNAILKKIKATNLEIKEKGIVEKINEINKCKDTMKTFKAIRELSRKPAENPYVHDEKGRNITQPDAIYRAVRTHFNNHFNDENQPTLKQFLNPPAPLTKPIVVAEVVKATKKLNNNRAAGHDHITAELIKYAPAEVHTKITSILNRCFTHNEPIQVSKGMLVALPKPKKPKGPLKNLRPVILLPIIRKILSNITLERIKDRVNVYLSASQSAYREKRSTSDIVCCHRWVAARIQKFQETVYITGIDMSSAFDTIRRQKLLEIFATFLEQDEVRIIQFLLSDTTLDIKMDGVSEPKEFSTNMGSPQGDALSGMCFNVYFENALRKLRMAMSTNPIFDEHLYHQRIEMSLPEECIYADDYDYITDKIEQRDKLNLVVKEILEKENLLVNESKTENVTIVRNRKTKDKTVIDEPWRLAIKLGSKLGDTEDIAYRKQLSNVTLHTIEDSWVKKDHVKQSIKLQAYKALVKPILLYNASTWGLTATDEKSLDAFHRQQLRYVLNVKYPRIMRNITVYKTADEKPLSLQILSARWRLLGHCLRLPTDTPVMKAIRHYFKPSSAPGFRGKSRTTLPVTLHNDILRVATPIRGPFGILGLKTSNDLDKLIRLADNRKEWTQLVNRLYDAAEVSISAGPSS